MPLEEDGFHSPTVATLKPSPAGAMQTMTQYDMIHVRRAKDLTQKTLDSRCHQGPPQSPALLRCMSST